MRVLLERSKAAHASEQAALVLFEVALAAALTYERRSPGRLWALTLRRLEVYHDVAEYARRCERDLIAYLMGSRL